MPTFKVAHVREQGVDLIIAPLTSSFGSKTQDDQEDFIATLQMAAQSAGLAGTVVPVWESGRRLHFIAPHNWHAFFRGISMAWVQSNVNRSINW